MPTYAEFELQPEIIERADALSREIASIYDNLRDFDPFNSPQGGRKLLDGRKPKASSKDAAIISPHGVELCMHCVNCVMNDVCPMAQLVDARHR